MYIQIYKIKTRLQEMGPMFFSVKEVYNERDGRDSGQAGYKVMGKWIGSV
jgi:hypothetical protein